MRPADADGSLEQLVTLLRARPDLVPTTQEPISRAALAHRAASTLSVQRALNHLHRAQWDVLHTLVILGADSAEVSHESVAEYLNAEVTQIVPLLQSLKDQALVRESARGFSIPASVRRGLPPQTDTPQTPQQLRLTPPPQPTQSARTVTGSSRVAQQLMENATSATVTDALTEMATVIGHTVFSRAGLKATTQGRVYKTAVTALAKDIGREAETVNFWLDAAHALGLMVWDRTAGFWVRTPQWQDAWADQPRADQWALLMRVWLTSRTAPWDGPEAADPHNAAHTGSAALPRLRRSHLLVTAHELGCTVAELPAALAWRYPRLARGTEPEIITALSQEAQRLGLFAAGGALSPLGEHVAAGDISAAHAWVESHLPPLVTEISVLADHTIIAPGTLDPSLSAELKEFTEQVSSGAATIYRLTESSIRAALDTGEMTAEHIAQVLQQSSTTPVPETVTQLIADVQRQVEARTVGAAGAWFRCANPEELTGILEAIAQAEDSRNLPVLHRISDTVAISPSSPTVLARQLDALGFTPTSVHASDSSYGSAAGSDHAQRRRLRRLEKLRAAQADLDVQLGSSTVADTGFPILVDLTDEDLAARILSPEATAPSTTGGSEADADPASAWAPDPEDFTPIELIRLAAERSIGMRITWADTSGAPVITEVTDPQLADTSGTLRDGDSAQTAIPLHRIVTAEPLS